MKTADIAEVRAPQVAVIDLPVDMTAEDMARLIEGQSDGMYLLAVVPWPGTGARAFFRKHAQKPKPERNSGQDVEQAAVDAIIRAHPNLTPGRLADKLATKGYVRHPLAVAARRRHIELLDAAAAVRRGA